LIITITVNLMIDYLSFIILIHLKLIELIINNKSDNDYINKFKKL